jgi:hypothetical protein
MTKEQVVNWESRYHEVVWVKFEKYPWWPSFILDPQEVKDEKYRQLAISKVNKLYIIYFYGDYRYAFIAQSSIRPFTPKSRETLKNQTIPRYYEGSFFRALAEADAEVLRSKVQRLSWYFNGEDDTVQADETEKREANAPRVTFNEDLDVMNFGNFDFIPSSAKSLSSSAFLHSKDILSGKNKHHHHLLDDSPNSTVNEITSSSCRCSSSNQKTKNKVGKFQGNWESRYHEVVWVRLEQYPWWPACILNPLDVEPKLQRSALKKTNKEYSIYFYGDYRYGFVPPSRIQPYDEQTRNSLKNQEISKYYEGSFYRALVEADAEVFLTKEERLSWYFEDLDEPTAVTEHETSMEEAKGLDQNEAAATAEIADLDNIELLSEFTFGSNTNSSSILNSKEVISKKRSLPLRSPSKKSVKENPCSVVSPAKRTKITHILVKVRDSLNVVGVYCSRYSFRINCRARVVALSPVLSKKLRPL